MHPLLRTRFPLRLAGALGGLWCAWMAGAVYVRAYQTNEPAAPPPGAPQALTIAVRTVAIFPDLPFTDRWQAPAIADQPRPPAMQHASIASEDQIDPEPAKPVQERQRRVERHANLDRVCGSRGRHYFHHRSWLTWRCNR